MLWTDEKMDKFVKQYYPNFYKIYKSYKYNIQRCYVFRYLVLYKYCIESLSENMNNYQYFGKHLHVMYSTGPSYLTNMINNYGKMKDAYILTKKEYAGDCNVCNENTCQGGTYFTHIHGNSWHEIDSSIYNFLLCNKRKLLFGLLFVIIIILLISHVCFRKL